VIGGLLLVQEAGGAASDFQDGASLTEPNRAFGCTPGLRATVEELIGLKARS
jgi:hypothetical protein